MEGHGGATQIAALPQAISDVTRGFFSKQRAKELSLALVLGIGEFLFGLDPGAALSASQDYAEFLDNLKDRKDAYGERAVCLRLPLHREPDHQGLPLLVWVGRLFCNSVEGPSLLQTLHDSARDFVNEDWYAFFFRLGQRTFP